jgi:hypothetical protein
MPEFRDLKGQIFNHWTVLFVGKSKPRTHWWSMCVCGKVKEVAGIHLTTGASKSCGCVRPSGRGHKNYTHGGTSLYGDDLRLEYNSWVAMRGRCKDPHNKSWHNYGGRGITVCPRWDDLHAFVSDMGRRPSKAHTIERIDVNRGYEPGNCVWATHAQQARNRRTNALVEINGQTMTMTDARRLTGLWPPAIRRRIKAGLPFPARCVEEDIKALGE